MWERMLDPDTGRIVNWLTMRYDTSTPLSYNNVTHWDQMYPDMRWRLPDGFPGSDFWATPNNTYALTCTLYDRTPALYSRTQACIRFSNVRPARPNP